MLDGANGFKQKNRNGVWLIVASDVGMTQQIPQIKNYWLLERQCIQMAYVERSTVGLSHHGIFNENFHKMFYHTCG